MSVIVIGGAGQLGRALSSLDPSIVSLTSSELDVTDSRIVGDVLGHLAQPGDTVINAAAYTDVDGAEADAEQAKLVNADGARDVAAACAERDARLIHVSTDYVFGDVASNVTAVNGIDDQRDPIDTDHPCHPLSVYGRTKRAGERFVINSGATAVIVRTAWVFSTPTTGPATNFFSKIVELEQSRPAIRVVTDEIGSPTYAPDLASGLLALAGRPFDTHIPPIVHCANSGRASRWEFARAIFAALGADPQRVSPCASSDFPTAAHRPSFSVLSPRSWVTAGLPPLPSWQDALGRAVVQLRR